MADNRTAAMAAAQLMTIEQAAEFLGYKKKYLYNLTSARAIPFVKCGPRRVGFRLEALEEWRDAQIVDVPTLAQVRDREQAEAARYCLEHRPRA